jgi:hypothetical protein
VQSQSDVRRGRPQPPSSFCGWQLIQRNGLDFLSVLSPVIRFAVLVPIALWALGCSSEKEEQPECLDAISTDCAPLYPPTFDNVFTNTLSKKCATTGGSCHGPAGHKGGLILANKDEAYAGLTGLDGATPRVDPNEPRCSEMIVRIDSPGKDWGMPPGEPLSAAERCAIRQWVAAGAVK